MLPDEVSGSLDSSDPQFRNLVFTSIFRLIIRIQIVRDLYGNNLINESNIIQNLFSGLYSSYLDIVVYIVIFLFCSARKKGRRKHITFWWTQFQRLLMDFCIILYHYNNLLD